MKTIIEVVSTALFAACAGLFVTSFWGKWPLRIVAIALICTAMWNYLPPIRKRE